MGYAMTASAIRTTSERDETPAIEDILDQPSSHVKTPHVDGIGNQPPTAHGERVTHATSAPDVGLFSSILVVSRSYSRFIKREPSLGSIQYAVKGLVVVLISNVMESEERL
jgi:hypothetical protein